MGVFMTSTLSCLVVGNNRIFIIILKVVVGVCCMGESIGLIRRQSGSVAATARLATPILSSQYTIDYGATASYG